MTRGIEKILDTQTDIEAIFELLKLILEKLDTILQELSHKKSPS